MYVSNKPSSKLPICTEICCQRLWSTSLNSLRTKVNNQVSAGIDEAQEWPILSPLCMLHRLLIRLLLNFFSSSLCCLLLLWFLLHLFSHHQESLPLQPKWLMFAFTNVFSPIKWFLFLYFGNKNKPFKRLPDIYPNRPFESTAHNDFERLNVCKRPDRRRNHGYVLVQCYNCRRL